jgi:hypothetical protein
VAQEPLETWDKERQVFEEEEAMIYKPKGRRYYMVKFMWRGQLIRKSTRATTAKDARSIEGMTDRTSVSSSAGRCSFSDR